MSFCPPGISQIRLSRNHRRCIDIESEFQPVINDFPRTLSQKVQLQEWGQGPGGFCQWPSKNIRNEAQCPGTSMHGKSYTKELPMQLTPLTFSRIDQPVEAFVTPPNDPLVGILMDALPKDHIDIKGTVGGKDFSYAYSLDKAAITMQGTFDTLKFECEGTFSKEVSLNGHLGDNELSSTIRPEVAGPFNDTRAGDMKVQQKIDINPFTGIISIHGTIGGEELEETIRASEDGTRIMDKGSLGGLAIDREVTRIDRGFCIRGTIGGLDFEEFIAAPPPGSAVEKGRGAPWQSQAR
jgi:hypothetical protein